MKQRIRLTESDLHRIVNASVNRILREDQEGYNQVMRVLDNPSAQKGLKKAWKRTLKRNPNADYDSFEYNYALNSLNRKREEDERYGTMKESVNKMLREGVNAHMGIDDICNLLGGGEKGYNTLNMILWSLQEQGAVEFHEDVLDELYNSPSY